MQPPNASRRLVALAGPNRGEAYTLAEGDLRIGRASSNWLCVLSAALSREHCLLRVTGDQVTVTDLHSRNGTFVNGRPVSEHPLQHGDELRLGDAVFVVMLNEESAPAPVNDLHDAMRSHRELDPSETIYLSDRIRPLDPAAAARDAMAVRGLLRLSTAIQSAPGVGAIAQDLLRLTREMIPAQRLLLLMGGESGDPVDLRVVHHIDFLGKAAQPSLSVLRRVLQTRRALLSSDLPAGTDAPSLLGTTSVLAVPLTAFQQIRGILYLDTSDPLAAFTPDHLELAAAIGPIAALALARASHLEDLEAENVRLLTEARAHHDMIGETEAMRRVYDRIARVAPTDATVLIQGESGTGKELAAAAVHRGSPRSAKPFVAVNCAAIAATLLESELFGHEKGAFTGAIAQTKGKIERAEGGTLFLDEIGELAPALQAKLLRVLQEREYERVGGSRTLRADIRVVAATNRPLEDAVKEGRFREDLYYRLNVVTITMPPLRQRRDDIPLLAQHFLAVHCERCKRPPIGLSHAARRYLLQYDWPGNVRELANAIERAVVLAASNEILPEDLPEALLETPEPDGVEPPRIQAAIKDTKRRQILEALGESRGNVTEAARRLGVHPNYLHRLINNLGLRDEIRKRLSER